MEMHFQNFATIAHCLVKLNSFPREMTIFLHIYWSMLQLILKTTAPKI